MKFNIEVPYTQTTIQYGAFLADIEAEDEVSAYAILRSSDFFKSNKINVKSKIDNACGPINLVFTLSKQLGKLIYSPTTGRVYSQLTNKQLCDKFRDIEKFFTLNNQNYQDKVKNNEDLTSDFTELKLLNNELVFRCKNYYRDSDLNSANDSIKAVFIIIFGEEASKKMQQKILMTQSEHNLI